MSDGISRVRRRFLPALCFASLLALVTGCAPKSPATTGADAPAKAAPQAAAERPAEPATNGSAPAETADPQARQRPKGFDFPSAPADGKWLVDDQGRRYFVHEVAKIEGTYERMFNNTRIKFWWTPPFELIREDDQSFFVKIFGVEEPVAPAGRPATATAEQIAASYQASAGKSDRLRFTPWSQGLPARGQWRQGFDVKDVDGDGNLDIVHGPPRKGGTAPAIFLGDGKGRWKRWTGLRLPAELQLDYGDAAAADFNGDGVTDLAFASHLRGTTVLVGDGKGGFKPWSQGIDFQMPGEDDGKPVFSSRAIEVVDWDRDGRPDILALGEGPTMSARSNNASYSKGSRGAVLYLNQGDGTWRRREAAGTSFGDALVIGELNGDGRPDFITASASQGNQKLLNLGAEDGTWQETSLSAVRPGATFRGVAAADFNGDGREDVAVGYTSFEGEVWRTGVDVLLARVDGSWERRPLGVEEKSSAGIWALDAGDLDGDDAADLVALTGNGGVWVFLGNGKGSFTREDSAETTLKDLAGCKGYHVRLEDLDGDGAAEVIAEFAGEGEDPFGIAAERGQTEDLCPSGGSLRVWKGQKQSGR